MTKESTVFPASELDWMKAAACTGNVPREVFFPGRNGSIKALAIIKPYCDVCPVIAECLAHALKHEESGVWAGTTTQDRRAMKRQLSQSGATGSLSSAT